MRMNDVQFKLKNLGVVLIFIEWKEGEDTPPAYELDLVWFHIKDVPVSLEALNVLLDFRGSGREHSADGYTYLPIEGRGVGSSGSPDQFPYHRRGVWPKGI
jgi:hypothetical protein